LALTPGRWRGEPPTCHRAISRCAYENTCSTQWIIEKKVISDMVLQVEGAHERDFWSVWAENGVPFEITMYNLHIMARKLELVDTVFSRYRVMETEREMRHFGLGMSTVFPSGDAQQSGLTNGRSACFPRGRLSRERWRVPGTSVVLSEETREPRRSVGVPEEIWPATCPT